MLFALPYIWILNAGENKCGSYFKLWTKNILKTIIYRKKVYCCDYLLYQTVSYVHYYILWNDLNSFSSSKHHLFLCIAYTQLRVGIYIIYNRMLGMLQQILYATLRSHTLVELISFNANMRRAVKLIIVYCVLSAVLKVYKVRQIGSDNIKKKNIIDSVIVNLWILIAFQHIDLVFPQWTFAFP